HSDKPVGQAAKGQRHRQTARKTHEQDRDEPLLAINPERIGPAPHAPSPCCGAVRLSLGFGDAALLGYRHSQAPLPGVISGEESPESINIRLPRRKMAEPPLISPSRHRRRPASSRSCPGL